MGTRLGYLGEVVPLYEVSGNVTGRCTIDTRSNVMPRHPRICTSAQLVYREREVKRRISHLNDYGKPAIPVNGLVSSMKSLMKGL